MYGALNETCQKLTGAPMQGRASQNIYSLVDQLSIRSLPFRVFDSQGEDSRSRPSSLLGWQDVKHLAALSKKEKKLIKQIQKDNGFKKSKF